MAFLDSISNNMTSIVIFILCIIILYLFFTSVTKADGITQLQEAHIESQITPTDMGLDTSNESERCAYSIWVYVSDWSYGYGGDKIIFEKANGNLKVYLDKHENNLVVSRKTCNQNTGADDATDGTPDSSSTGANSMTNTDAALAAREVADAADLKAIEYESGVTSAFTLMNQSYKEGMTDCDNSTPFNCVVSNIPVQKWVNIIVSLDSRTLDIYVNGKLVKTCYTEPPKSAGSNNQDNNLIKLTSSGGFAGYTSKFKYFSNPMNPQTAWNTYQKGWSETNIFGLNASYDVDLVVTKNGKQIF